MAKVPPKDIHRLIVELAARYSHSDDARRIMKNIGLNSGNVDLTGAPQKFWKNTMELIVEFDKQIADVTDTKLYLLLIFVTKAEECSDSEVFNSILDEFQYGYIRRLEVITEAIRDRKCILFLGPNVLRCREGRNTPEFNRVLAREMALELEFSDVFFAENQRENLSYIAQRYTEITNYALGEQGRKARELYSKKKSSIDERNYHKLARLPWKLVINTNPDDWLAKIINDKKPGQCQYSYYSIANQPMAVTQFPANSDGVLLYNLFGSFEDEYSILLSESQFLCFTRKAMAKDPALDPKVRGEFESKDYYYLFLGFDFDPWYPKIIFDTILKLTRAKNRAFSAIPEDVVINQSNREFFEEEFKIYFVNNDMDLFLDDIIDHYFGRD